MCLDGVVGGIGEWREGGAAGSEAARRAIIMNWPGPAVRITFICLFWEGKRKYWCWYIVSLPIRRRNSRVQALQLLKSICRVAPLSAALCTAQKYLPRSTA